MNLPVSDHRSKKSLSIFIGPSRQTHACIDPGSRSVSLWKYDFFIRLFRRSREATKTLNAGRRIGKNRPRTFWSHQGGTFASVKLQDLQDDPCFTPVQPRYLDFINRYIAFAPMFFEFSNSKFSCTAKAYTSLHERHLLQTSPSRQTLRRKFKVKLHIYIWERLAAPIAAN